MEAAWALLEGFTQREARGLAAALVESPEARAQLREALLVGGRPAGGAGQLLAPAKKLSPSLLPALPNVAPRQHLQQTAASYCCGLPSAAAPRALLVFFPLFHLSPA